MNDKSKPNQGMRWVNGLGAVMIACVLYALMYDMAGSTFMRQTFSTPTTCTVYDGFTSVTVNTSDPGSAGDPSGGSARYVKVRCDFSQAKALGGTQYVDPLLSAENEAGDMLGYWDSKTRQTVYWNDLTNLPHKWVRKGNVYPCTAAWTKPKLPFTLFDAGVGGGTIYIQDCRT